MTAAAEPASTSEDGEAIATDDADAQLELLREENRRLRERYARIRQTRHRRTAMGLGVLGGVAIVGAVAFPDVRVVLVVLGSVGLFGGLLTWYLTPERFLAADVGERVFAALAGNEAAIAAALGLADRPVYVPLEGVPDREAVVYLPQRVGAVVPATADLSSPFVVPDDDDARGLGLRPTGDPLLTELRAAMPGGLADEPVALVDQLVDGLREQFELIETAHPEVDARDGRASIAVGGSAYGDVTRFDHPVVSVLATGLAVGLDVPVTAEVDRTPGGRGEWLVTTRWETTDDGTAATDPAVGDPD